MIKIYTIETEQTAPKPLDEVFPFFSTPENLAKVTPPSLGFRILTPSPIEMKEGALIDYTIQILGFPLRWRTYISKYDPPREFVDESLKGPYSLWHHTHRFTEVDGKTRINDSVRYVIPGGPLAPIPHALYVKSQLRKIFNFRERVIREQFGESNEPATLKFGTLAND